MTHKNCNGCKALGVNQCLLGYRVLASLVNVGGALVYNFSPLEECPKPMTNNNYITLVLRKEK